ncbi:hypothetical protein GIB67_014635 [Kingdonia uniflora]|uniref:DEUBAD domain-containing protein n=1 Tax=Kingdonia uniflora TaxID=39325 RepID=A0A7J7NV22_9MAGN|nr:hypothetical protein GIB67_014635 [Kingdonia uniflora]
MAIQKKLGVLRLEQREFTPISRESGSSDGDDEPRSSDSEFNGEGDVDMYDCDSGAGSDDGGVLELGGVMEEVCQVGNQKCSFPIELYDVPSLKEILSVDAWNDMLTEEDRFRLTEYLPDMDQWTLMFTLKELFTGVKLDFGSPLDRLLSMLKGGLCEPKVAQYQQCLKVLQKREHYHNLYKYQNSKISRYVQIKGLLENNNGYTIEERLRVLYSSRSQKDLMYPKMENQLLLTGSKDKKEANDVFQKIESNKVRPTLDYVGGAQPNPRGLLKLAPSTKELGGHVPPIHNGLVGKKTMLFDSRVALHQQRPVAYDSVSGNKTRGQIRDIDGSEKLVHARPNTTAEGGLLKQGIKRTILKTEVDTPTESLMGMPFLKNDSLYSHSKNKSMNRSPNMEKRVNGRNSFSYRTQDGEQRGKYHDKFQRSPVENHQHLLLKGIRVDWSEGTQPFRHKNAQQETYLTDQPVRSNEWDARNKKFMIGNKNMGYSPKREPYTTLPSPMNDPLFTSSDYRDRTSHLKIGRRTEQNGGSRDLRQHTPSEETESDDSSEEVGEEYDISTKYRYPSDVLKGGHSAYNKSTPDQKKAIMFDRNMYSSNQKSNIYDTNDMLNYPTGVLHKNNFSGSSKFTDDAKRQSHNLGKTGYVEERKWKGKADYDNNVPHSSYIGGEDGNFHATANKSVIKVPNFQKPDMLLLGCDTVTKKRKGKPDLEHVDGSDYLHSTPQQIDDILSLKKRGKRKPEAETGSVDPERAAADVEPETRPLKAPFTLITPTVHSGFSFSIVHLLSAVRMAMITDTDINTSENIEQKTLPSLTIQEIVNRVRSNPGDPSILETQEPLQDLVRGVLKIFSSKTAPLGSKGWKPLAVYEKSTKCWSWIGPVVSANSSDPEYIEEETSSGTWGLPHKVLVKLVDSFANWLKNGQVTLQQIGTLPPPPVALMQPYLDEKERFRDLRAQKSLTTITASCQEVRAYFRQEEFLRYSVPDRAFSYTAADGKKSIVAPLRRCGGKPTSKARDHFMLKPDRPPHITILCLVRDAASRLPGGIGTRADVCTLIRDSQYIVEDVSDAQVNQAVSGALDRLHYERDPCVQFDGDRKLWVYLHRDREEEDFEDDGTASTKKWKRQKKDPTEQSGGAGEQIAGVSGVGYDLSCDLNVDASAELIYNDLRPNIGEGATPFIGSVQGGLHPGRPGGSWNVIGLNPLRENKIICQENSANDDLDGETFSRRRHIGVLNGSLM